MIVFSTTLISIILYAVFRNKATHSHLPTTSKTIGWSRREWNSMSSNLVDSIVILEIVNLFLLALSLFGTVSSWIKIRKLDYRRTTTRENVILLLLLIFDSIRTGFDDVLIIVSLAGIYLYSIFSAFAIISNLHSSTWMIYVKVAIILLGRDAFVTFFSSLSFCCRVYRRNSSCSVHSHCIAQAFETNEQTWVSSERDDHSAHYVGS